MDDRVSNFIPAEEVAELLAEFISEGKWDEVIKMYVNNPLSHIEMIEDYEATALHVTVDMDEVDVALDLLREILKPQEKLKYKQGRIMALEMGNKEGDTPLHYAASRGITEMCVEIIGRENERKYLGRLKNRHGETPLFQAAINGRKEAFAYLSNISDNNAALPDLVRHDGDTILHCAIRNEYFDLAVIILHYYDFLRAVTNNYGEYPLKVLATRPSAFKSSTYLSFWKRILYHFITVEQLDAGSSIMQAILEKTTKKLHNYGKVNYPKNYTVLIAVFTALCGIGKLPVQKKNQRDLENPSNTIGFETRQVGLLPPNYQTIHQFVKYSCVLILGLLGQGKLSMQKKNQRDLENPSNTIEFETRRVGFLPPNYQTIHQFAKYACGLVLGHFGQDIKEIRNTKRKHQWGRQLLKALMLIPRAAFTGSGGVDLDMYNIEIDLDMYNVCSQWQQGETSDLGWLKKKTKVGEKIPLSEETAFFVAAKNGIVEMVNEILSQNPMVIREKNSLGDNVLLVAVRNRRSHVVKSLERKLRSRKSEVWKTLTLAVDKDEKTLLHLAADAPAAHEAWQISGAALQMMWDVNWYQYIKSLVPQHYCFRRDIDEKIPREIFKEKHIALRKESSEWLRETSESCSVVAVLVAGASFATAATIPGGTDDKGKPHLEDKPAFQAFVIASLIGLCFSVTGLIMFRTILTSRKLHRDFRKDLPLQLLIGLSSLFVSIVALLVSFCAGHSSLFTHKYMKLILPIYVATCLPVIFYAVSQLPLFFDLLTAILAKVPQLTDEGESL